MKKIIIGLFVLLSACKVYSTELSFAYNTTEYNGVKRYLREVGLKYEKENKKYSFNMDTKIKQTEISDSFYFDLIGSKKVDKNWDIWGALSYRDDKTMDILSRTDWKLGFGYVIYRKKTMFTERKIKGSYGMLFRRGDILHSLRLKDYFKTIGVGYKFQINYILPNGNKHYDELDFEIKPFIKIFNFEPSFSYSYLGTYTKKLYETKFALGISI